jgi:8-oxo-dGTP pyrophosphatase MutT (NUDIX family)
MERFKNGVCVDIILTKEIDNKKHILLMKRKNTGSDDGMYELPGGHLEKDEDLYDAMIRETKEELLIDLNKEDINLIYLLHHYTGERLNFIFTSPINNLEPKIGELNKCEELIWVPINNLPDNTTDKVKLIIKDIINEIHYNKL